MTETILTRSDAAILHITLNRSDDGNGVTDEMAGELAR